MNLKSKTTISTGLRKFSPAAFSKLALVSLALACTFSAQAQSTLVSGTEMSIRSVMSQVDAQALQGGSTAGSAEVGYGPLTLGGKFDKSKASLETTIENGVIKVHKGATVTGSKFSIDATATQLLVRGAPVYNGRIDIGE